MSIDRRGFLKRSLGLAGTALLGGGSAAQARENPDPAALATGNTANERNWEVYVEKGETLAPVRHGVLVDTTVCIGCRRCEWACNEWNRNPNRPVQEFEASASQKDSVFTKVRRMHAGNFTVVNRFRSSRTGQPIYVKRQCMHCEDPGCLSSCFVDAYRKTAPGPVIHNASVCIGCRYCMVACPFDAPAYEYYSAFTPQISKCTLCFDRVANGSVPSCVEICPAGALTFGKRDELLTLAHGRIAAHPGMYVDRVYGEQEVGGTSWLYLAAVPFEEIGFRTDLGRTPIPKLTQPFLASVKLFEVVASWPLVFGAYYAVSKARGRYRAVYEQPADSTGGGHGDEH